ncbi:UNVERIFIED_CONTAM: hypothetical protein Sindi_2899300 [Sesamum indicum]
MEGEDRIIWRFDHGLPTAQTLYKLFDPPEPKVDWSSLLSGSLKIPRHLFILWLAILRKLASIDKPWLAHLGPCILCSEGVMGTHGHLFFQCRFSRQCLAEIQKIVQFSWPNRDWKMGITWASRRWRGKHIINHVLPSTISIMCLPPWQVVIIEDIRQRIHRITLPSFSQYTILYLDFGISLGLSRKTPN